MEKKSLVQLEQSISKVSLKMSIVADLVNFHSLDIYEAAKRYKDMEMNVTCIAGYVNEQNKFYKDILKHPCHEWSHLLKGSQSEKEFLSYDWVNAIGVGTVTGVENLVGIDIDGCNEISVIENILGLLELPSTYDWVVRTGSNNGYHIIIKMKKPKRIAPIEVVSIYQPNSNFKNLIEKVEILWNTHLVLPPSRHKSNNLYRFMNTEFPNHSPITIREDAFYSFVTKVLKTDSKMGKRRYF